MAKLEDYSIALELLDACCKRNELIRIVEKLIGEGKIQEYVSIYNLERDNDIDITKAMELIGLDVVKELVEKELHTEDANKALEQAYINGGAVKKLYI